MKNIFIICLLILPALVSAQSLLRPPQLLEPMLPFAEAVEKAKANDPQGWYALAIHYAKGEEIEHDTQRVRQFLQKAYDMNYSNAVFVATLLDECLLQESESRSGSLFTRLNRSGSYQPNLSHYTGIRFGFAFSTNSLSITNAADVAKIRTGYKRAFKLGVSAATNELARFEQRVKAYRVKSRDDAEKLAMQKRNSELAISLLDTNQLQSVHKPIAKRPSLLQRRSFVVSKDQDKKEALRKRLNDPDADTDGGRTFLWEAGGKDGLSLDVLIRVKQNEGWHYIEKATITIDKDGKIIKVQGKPGVTEIQS
jgi:peroxiredoxin